MHSSQIETGVQLAYSLLVPPLTYPLTSIPISQAPATVIAKMDAWIVEITLVSAPAIGQWRIAKRGREPPSGLRCYSMGLNLGDFRAAGPR